MISAYSFADQLRANVDNEKLDDAAFREVVRNTLPIVLESIEEDYDYADLSSKHLKIKQALAKLRQVLGEV